MAARFAVLSVLFVASLACALAATPARAQLRPYEPLDWRAFTPGRSLSANVGLCIFDRQRASLAGAEGTLVDAGNFVVTYRTGAVAVEVAGTTQRFFSARSVFAAPHGGAIPIGDGKLHDSGDYRISTAVRLTPENARGLAVIRFGTRLPTTEKTGSGWTATRPTSWGLVGGRTSVHGVALSAETGVGINCTRNPGFKQSDVWVYIAAAEYDRGWIAPRIQILGHMDGLDDRTIRGNEDLGEVRVGVRAGRSWWVRADLVRGYTKFSPSTGVIVSGGLLR